MQDLEFTIQNGKLWMLQTRNGKRTGAAMVRIAMEMLKEGLIDAPTAVLRVEPAKLDELLHPVFDKKALKQACPPPRAPLRGRSYSSPTTPKNGPNKVKRRSSSASKPLRKT